jgi:predicted KAP-like P-loop ATPase
MFIDDRPIENPKDDRLGRLNFSEKLAKSIIEWKGIDSLVIALYAF